MPEDYRSNAAQGSEANSMADKSNGADTPSFDGADTPPSAPKPQDSMDISVLAKQIADKERYIREQKNQINELSAMVSELNGKYDGLTATLNKPAEDTSFEDKVYSDLPKTLLEIQSNLEKKFEAKLAAKEKELWNTIEDRDANMKMWNGFYDDNKHLAPLRNRIIPTIVNELNRAGKFDGLSAEDKLDLVAKEANKEYLSLKRSMGSDGGNGEGNRAPNMRTSHSGTQGQQQGGLPKDPVTLKELSDVMNTSHEEAVSRIK
jgi:hypothetical protein